MITIRRPFGTELDRRASSLRRGTPLIDLRKQLKSHYGLLLSTPLPDRLTVLGRQLEEGLMKPSNNTEAHGVPVAGSSPPDEKQKDGF